MPDDAAPSVAAFFADYRAAFETLDPEAVAGYFAYPCHVTSDGDVPQLTTAASREEWRDQIAQLIALYEQVGVATADLLSLSESVLSPRVAQARVHWMLRDAAGRDLYDFDALYTLVRTDGGFAIAALAHDELPKLLALLSGDA